MAANTVTYFGDVTTVGNTTVTQNLTFQGSYSIFSGNVTSALAGVTSFTVGGGVFSTVSNTTSVNVTSLYGTTGNFIGLNTTGSGASLNVAGNTWTSNALAAPTVLANAIANVVTLNTAYITGPLGLIGIGAPASGATLNVYGNVWASNALSAPNVFATTSANLASLNTATIFSSSRAVGINITGTGGWSLNVAGNAWVSNSIGAQNVSSTSFANVTTLNTSRIVSTTGFVGLNCEGGGAILNVAGNVYVSNALATPNIFVTTANVTSLNTATIIGTAGFVGINTTGSGYRLNVAGNVYASNALIAPNIYATTSINVAVLNTATIIGTAGFVGINTTGSGYRLNVAGNVYVSNALVAPNISAITSANVAVLNTATISGFVGINVAGSGATLNVLGNVWISNAVAATNVIPTMNANVTTTNVTYMSLYTAGLGINTPAQASGGASVMPFFTPGTLNGDAAPVNNAPTSNLALAFSSSSTSYVNMGLTSPTHVDISTTDIFVEAWIYATAMTTSLINIASYGNGTTSGWRLRASTAGVAAQNDQKSLTGVGSCAAGQWTYVAFKFSGGRIYAWVATTGATTVNNTTTAPAPTYSASDPFYIGAADGVGGLAAGGTLYIRDLRVISGTSITNTGNFTPDQAPFTAAVPLYVTGTGLAYSWGLQASGSLGLAPYPLVKVAGNIWCSNAFQSPNVLVTNVLATTSNLGPTATMRVFSPAAGGIVGVGQVPTVGSATLQVTGNVFASNALQSANIAAISANSVFSNVTSNLFTNSNQRLGVNKASPSSNLDVAGNVLVTTDITASGIDQQLPIVPFTGAGVAGAYTNVTNGVTFTVGATAETSGHEAWRAVTTPATFSSGVSIPPAGRFQLFERDSMSVGNTLWSPNGRYYYTVNATTQTIQDYYLSSTLATQTTSTITSLYLTTAGFLQGVNSTGSIVYTSANSASGYGPYRFAMENQGFAAIYDRYNTILYQFGAVQATASTYGTYGGDTVTTSGGYRIHTFTTVGASKFVIPNYLASLTCDYLIVGGGGGGGGHVEGGGGGAGGVIAASSVALSNGVYTVTVGAGGNGATASVLAQNGGNSSIIGGSAISQTATGGGGGGCEFSVSGPTQAGQNGGSGGGGSWPTLTGGTATAGQGFNGGTAFNGANYTGAGGGGAGAAGQNSTSTTGGAGGNGIASSITGSSITYAGGGGGSARGSAVFVSGGTGGGGRGYGAGNGENATYYGGGGGAGGNSTDTVSLGGNGYQGIVIIRYLISSVAVSNAWGFSNIARPILTVAGYTYVPFSALPVSAFTLTASGGNSDGNAWYISGTTLYDGATAAGASGSVISLTCTQPSDIYSTVAPGTWYTLTSGGLFARHSGFNMFMQAYVAGNYDFAWQFYLKDGTTDQIIIHNPYPADGVGYWVQSNLSRIKINTQDPTLAQVYTISQPISLTSLPTLTFRMPTMYLPTSLLIQGVDYNNSSNSANAFIFSGSTDGTTYTTLVNGLTYLSNTDYGYNIYSITTNTAWTYFQLRVMGADTTPGYVNQLVLNGQISWSPTANAVRVNVATQTNVFSIAGNVGINTSTGGGATIRILGNVYASNALFGTIRSPLANITTPNTSILYGTSGVVGISTTPVAGGATLQIGYGNVYASNAISAPNVSVTTIQSYNEDLTRQSPHLMPTPSNSATIVNWMKAACNASQKVGWTSGTPVFSNVLTNAGPLGSTSYRGTVLLPDGRVLFVPYADGNRIGIYNPSVNQFSIVVPSGAAIPASQATGGVVAPSGNVIFASSSNIMSFNPISYELSNAFRINTSAICPILDPLGNVVFVPYNTQTQNVQTYNPRTNQASNVSGTRLNAGTGSFAGGVLLPNGNIAFIPADISNVCLYSPFTQVLSNTLRISTLADKFKGGVLAPDGNVVCVPYDNLNVCVVNVLNPPYTFTNIAHGVAGGAVFYGGVTTPSGNVILVNALGSNIGMVDPVAMTYSNIRTTGPGWRHGTLIPDGRIVFGSYNSSNIGVLGGLQPISREFCRSPYFNKF